MSEHQRKNCKVNVENSEKEISIKLTYSKRDKDVDIRDFFSKAMEKFSDLEVHFKKGHYELMSKGQQHVLEMVPNVIEIFQTFYKGSFGERDDHTSASTRASVPRVNEQKKSEEEASTKYSGPPYRGSALNHNRPQKEEETPRESKPGSLGLAKDYADEDETANLDDGRTSSVHNSGIKQTGTTQGSKLHNDPQEVNKHRNKIPGSDEEYNQKDKKKNDSNGMKKKKDNEDGEDDKEEKSTHHDNSKEVQKNLSSSKIKTSDCDAEHDKKEKEKDDSNDKQKKKGNNDGEEDKDEKSKHHDNSKEVEKNLSTAKIKTSDCNAEYDKKQKEKDDSNDKQKKKGNNDGEEEKEDKSEHHNGSKEVQKNLSSSKIKTPEADAKHDKTQKEKDDSNDKEKKKGNNDGEQKKETSQDVDRDDEVHVHQLNYKKTGNQQGSKGYDESKGARMKDSNTTNKMMHENDEHDGDEKRQLNSAVDSKVKSHDANKERAERCNAEEASKGKHGDSQEYF